ncbi:diaminopimelate decarboxylase [Reichenbachiella agariperforans]|uniref:Diaminopimelate decarboxylase n=1 Tax=Reichenbachiella agariperforans TaxID=156994 RepID=A0A1M6Q2X9_REIAG|nr:diaminopimelate decarboxylase [Reichenbachiella agariperforans]SHK14518.1 diaminopimelate decarboxylase [Reichenbachiella agariperforans]
MQKIQTPFYYYDLDLLDQTLSKMVRARGDSSFHVHYALKANAEAKILAKMKATGLGVDCVSGGEVRYALEQGFGADQIVYAGVGKTDWELELAISSEVHGINCESIEELVVIAEVANKLQKSANVYLRLNPNIDAKTHPNITTGTLRNKFGIPANELWLALEELAKYPCLVFAGLHFHIGSQIEDLSPFVRLCTEVNVLQKALRDKGYNPANVNVGGGLGIDYKKPDANPIADFDTYFENYRRYLNIYDNQQVHFELGRSLVGQVGYLFSEVLYIKKTKELDFAIIDAGMSELMRPALYGARHVIQNVSSVLPDHEYEVVGPICESTDTFGKHVLPTTQRGDLLQIRSVGAYGSVLSTQYNMRGENQPMFSDEENAQQFFSALHAEV